ncbi:unnamed protein product [Allacma fusca]|uniref:CCHC-type domain-containing protein n=1 Tax=Allacma fusca TaxID=39272 RepID=A0A8J2L5H8_9HEXA|nr:unnamed protein product [Allacma fusca]
MVPTSRPTNLTLQNSSNTGADTTILTDPNNPFQALDIFKPVRPNSPTSLHFNTASNSLVSSRANSPRPPNPQTATMDTSRFLFDKPKFPSREISSDDIWTFLKRCDEFFTALNILDDDIKKAYVYRNVSDASKTGKDFLDYYYTLPSTSRRTYAQFSDDLLNQMPRDIPDRKSKILDALYMSPYPNEMPTIFALRVRTAAGTDWKSLPEKTTVDSIRSKQPSTVNIFLQSWNDRLRTFSHLLDALREYEACALNQNPPVTPPSATIPVKLGKKLDTVLERLTKLESKETTIMAVAPYQQPRPRNTYSRPPPTAAPRPVTCWSCGKIGHVARVCRSTPSSYNQVNPTYNQNR